MSGWCAVQWWMPGATSMQHLAELMDSLPWWTFVPAPELIAGQPGVDDPRLTVVAARGDDGRIGLVYIPRGSEAKLERCFIADSPQGVWVDPRTGERQPAHTPADGVVTVPDGEDLLVAIAGRFPGGSGLEEFIKQHGIGSQFWSRSGD